LGETADWIIAGSSDSGVSLGDILGAALKKRTADEVEKAE
jgi:hypothetical protein